MMNRFSRIKKILVCLGVFMLITCFISDSQNLLNAIRGRHPAQLVLIFGKDNNNGAQGLHSKIGKPTVTYSVNHIKQFKILGWTDSKYGLDWGMNGSKPFETCEYSNCYGITDKNQYNSSDVILFMARRINSHLLPKHRFPSQKWVFHEHESPKWEIGYSKYNKLFNVTWTYSRTSDIWTNYSHPGNLGGSFKKISEKSSKNYALGKTKPIAWFVSRCRAEKMFRFNYAKNLQKYIPVDIYGHCGPLKCGKQFRYGYGQNKTDCLELLDKKYKFYLSFENSLCNDYVTEKLWTALRLNIVPVVLGAYNYSELLPPKSYIDIKDYSSPKKLAEYLHTLDRNDTLYSEYLEWKDTYKIVPHAPYQCSVCEYINKSAKETKVYDRLDLFWNEKSQCHTPEDYFQNIDPQVWID